MLVSQVYMSTLRIASPPNFCVCFTWLRLPVFSQRTIVNLVIYTIASVGLKEMESSLLDHIRRLNQVQGVIHVNTDVIIAGVHNVGIGFCSSLLCLWARGTDGELFVIEYSVLCCPFVWEQR